MASDKVQNSTLDCPLRQMRVDVVAILAKAHMLTINVSF